MKAEEKVYTTLEQLGIGFSKHEHPAVYTVEEAKKYYDQIPGGHCKNLFLRDKKGKKHVLVVAPWDKQVNLKNLSGTVGADNLSFASPRRLMDFLGLEPGSVSPFGIINDENHSVLVVVDRDLFTHHQLNFHPNVNSLTITIGSTDFQKFLAESKNEIRYVTL